MEPDAHEQLRRQCEYEAMVCKGQIKQYVRALLIWGFLAVAAVTSVILFDWLRIVPFLIMTILSVAAGVAVLMFLHDQYLLMERLRRKYRELEGCDLKYDAENLKWINRCIVCLLLFVTVLLGGYLFHRIWLNHQIQKTFEALKEYQVPYRKAIEECVPEKMRDMQYVTDVEASASLTFGMRRNGDYYRIERRNVTLYVTNQFDSLRDDRQYEYLYEFHKRAENAIFEVYKEKLAELSELERSFSKLVQKQELRDITYDDDRHFYVVTSKNRYEYASQVKDYFVLNGKDHFTTKYRNEHNRKMVTPTPTPVPRSGSSTTRKKYVFDYDDVHNYTDPEDFWEDHEDEFEDFEDAWDYWEENQ